MGLCCCKDWKGHLRAPKGGAGEREKMPANPEAFLLMASSQRDMEDWVRAIRRVIWAPRGGGTARSPRARPLAPQPLGSPGLRRARQGLVRLTRSVFRARPGPQEPASAAPSAPCRGKSGIFGQRLEDTVLHERKFGPRLAPLLVEQCVDFILERGLAEEGLFRLPGQATLVRDLQDSFDCGEKPLFDSTTDVHTVASLLKLYLRELPEPVIPFSRYDAFLSCAQLLTKDEREGTLELATQVNDLPQANYNLLRYICKFLDKVQSHSDVNKMSVQNLATVFGPNILRPQMEDPVTMMEGTSLVQHLMTVLIRKHGQLFTTEGPAPPCGDPPRPAGWGSRETASDGGAPPSPSAPGLPTQRTSSLDGAAAAALSRTPSTGRGSPGAARPGKRGQTLPTWKSSFRPSGSRPASPQAADSSLEAPPAPSGGNWLVNGLSSLRGHRRASSGDRLKDTGSSQRLSTYDNVPLASSPSVASAAWSAASSSWEASAAGSVSSCSACRASDSSARSSPQAEGLPAPSPRPSSSSEEGRCPDEGAAGASSSEPSDPGSPAQNRARRSGALQGLVAELRAELCRQRTEYETSVRSLEEGSADLRRRLSQLAEELEQERRRYTMLEIKLRNSERAREDAERRNRLLQSEMEEFFATLGSLTAGGQGAGAPK